MKYRIIAAAALAAMATPALAAGIDSARSPYPSSAYSGGAVRPVGHRATNPAYRYSGPHAGGPADALIPNGAPRPVTRHVKAPAYRYSGPHAGGPANALPRT